MKIAVMGSGGVGGYFGARLAAGGEDVHFIARGAHLQAMLKDGLKIRSKAAGDLDLHPVQATDDPSAIGTVDAVLFAVKLYDVETAAEACRPLMGPNTILVSLQNGIDAEERIEAVLGKGRVAGGVAQIGANITAPGVIEHRSPFASLTFGMPDGSSNPQLVALAERCTAASIDVKVVDDIQAALWVKFVMLASFSAVTCLTRKASETLRDDPDVRRLYEDAVAEAVAVAAAKGVNLPSGTRERVSGFVAGMGNGMKSSMLVDLETGKRLELESLSGAIVRLADELGVSVPVHRVAYGALKPYLDGTPA